MDLNLKGKTALITGGSRGIGRAVAQTLASAGCNLVLTSRNADDLAKAKADIEAKPNVKVRIFAGDLAKGATVEQLAKDFPETDILVNNAGAIPGGSADPDRRATGQPRCFGPVRGTSARVQTGDRLGH